MGKKIKFSNPLDGVDTSGIKGQQKRQKDMEKAAKDVEKAFKKFKKLLG